MSTPLTDEFVSAISSFLQAQDAAQLRSYMLVEPPFPDIYSQLTVELRSAFPDKDDKAIEKKCLTLIPEDPDNARGTIRPSFVAFIKEYLKYLRDVNFDNLLETHDLLGALVNQCITVLSNASVGVVVLPTCLSISAALAKLAVTLDKKPELTAHLVRRASVAAYAEDPESKKSLVESTAELLQRGFTTCLTDRSAIGAGPNSDEKPEGKKTGIYSFANLVLRLLFQCRKIRLASQIFSNIAQHSPPLAKFPASQRVSYLYYLGRFNFSINQFYRALLALQGAYDSCHACCLKQRNLILTYLIGANIILGRLPSDSLLQRKEASGLGLRFSPICRAIIRGDLAGFKSGLEGENQAWFLEKGLLLPLRNRCELLIWRSLARKTFLLSGVAGDKDKRKAPTFSLHDLLVLARILEQRSKNSSGTQARRPRAPHISSFFSVNDRSPGVNPTKAEPAYVDSDLEGAEDVDGGGGLDAATGSTMLDMEAIIASLVDQGLLNGYLSHQRLRFAILGAKTKPPSSAGFPAVWRVLQTRARELAENEEQADLVPGWVKKKQATAKLAYGPGMVVNLKGARPAGAAPLIDVVL